MMQVAKWWLMTVALMVYVIVPLVFAEPLFLREIWFDEARQRHVNVKLAFPRSGPSKDAMPVLLFSAPQGWRWGGQRDSYEYLADEMVNQGIAMVIMSHYDITETQGTPEKFADIYPGILTGSRHDHAVDRYEDGRFVLRELTRRNGQSLPGWPKLEMETIAVGGHSAGVLTALHLCGLPVRDLADETYAAQSDPRIQAFVIFGYPMEYRGPRRGDLKHVRGVAGLHVVGSQDHPIYRNTSYRYIGGAPQYWLVAKGGHDVGDRGSRDLVREVTSRFLRAYLFKDASARNFMNSGKFEDPSGDLQQYRTKLVERWWHVDQRDFVAWVRDVLPWGKWLHNFSVSYHGGQKVKE